jgi:hypothetical protein
MILSVSAPGRCKWALLIRRRVMMPQPAARSNRQEYDGLRFPATPRGGCLPIPRRGPITPEAAMPINPGIDVMRQ